MPDTALGREGWRIWTVLCGADAYLAREPQTPTG